MNIYLISRLEACEVLLLGGSVQYRNKDRDYWSSLDSSYHLIFDPKWNEHLEYRITPTTTYEYLSKDTFFDMLKKWGVKGLLVMDDNREYDMRILAVAELIKFKNPKYKIIKENILTFKEFIGEKS